MNVVPDELAEVVHRAAAGTAEYPIDLSGIERRWRRRRRRRVVACAAGVAVLTAVSTAAIPVINARPGPARPPAAAADPAPQRLMVGGDTSSMMAEDITEGNVIDRRGAVELLPDSTVKRWPLPDLKVRYRVLGLPDDRLAVLDLPAAGRGGSPPVTYTLRILSPAGSVESATPVGTGAMLVTATADSVYLWQPEGIVAYPLAGGAHRVVVPAAVLDARVPRDMDLLGDRLVIVGSGEAVCEVRVSDLAGSFTDYPVSRRGCDDAGSVRISPDGRLAAVGYQRSNAPRVAVIDLATGASVADTPIRAPGGEPASPREMAWQDDTRLRVAVAVPPPDPDRTYYEEDLIRQQIVDVR